MTRVDPIGTEARDLLRRAEAAEDAAYVDAEHQRLMALDPNQDASELRSFLWFQVGGLRLIGEHVQQRKRRTRREPSPSPVRLPGDHTGA